jgi:four helix bundle protein
MNEMKTEVPAPPRNFKQLIAWQKAMRFVVGVYQATKAFPREELFGLTSQLRRAATSIPSNIAEGQGRATAADFRRFLSIALGSCAEIETQLILADDLGYLDDASSKPLLQDISEVARLLNGLYKSLVEESPP